MNILTSFKVKLTVLCAFCALLITAPKEAAALGCEAFYDDQKRAEWYLCTDSSTNLFSYGYRYRYDQGGVLFRIETLRFAAGGVSPQFPYLSYDITGLRLYNQQRRLEWVINFPLPSVSSPQAATGTRYTYDFYNSKIIKREQVTFLPGTYASSFDSYYMGAGLLPSFNVTSLYLYNAAGRNEWVINFPLPTSTLQQPPVTGTHYLHDSYTGKISRKELVTFLPGTHSGSFSNYYLGAGFLPSYNVTSLSLYDTRGKEEWLIRFPLPSGTPSSEVVTGTHSLYDQVSGKLFKRELVSFMPGTFAGSFSSYYFGAGTLPSYSINSIYFYDQTGKLDWFIKFSLTSTSASVSGTHLIYDLSGKLARREQVTFFPGTSPAQFSSYYFGAGPLPTYSVTTLYLYHQSGSIEWIINFPQYVSSETDNAVTGVHYLYRQSGSLMGREIVRFISGTGIHSFSNYYFGAGQFPSYVVQ